MTESQRRFEQSWPVGTAAAGRARETAAGGSGQAETPGDPALGEQTTIAGRYVIESRIGEGAHAITYRAHDLRLKRTVAIKVLRSHLASDAELVARFVREAELAASISHPNVVDVYDVGTDGGVSYIVMRLVPGQDLRHVLQADGRLPVSRATPLVRQILRGLGAIHAAGIVHRDVKPQNILITPDGTAQVTDFGVAYAALAEGLTTQGMTVGTASYMAPEQARGEPVTQATDIYAVGVVFYEMLTGRVPFTGDNPMTVMMAHLQSAPIPPSQAVPGLRIPPRIEEIILRAMAKEPARRFPSAAAMAEALSGTAAPAAARDGEATTVVGAAAMAQPTSMTGQPTAVRAAATGYGPPAAVRPAAPPWLGDQPGGGDSAGPPPPTLSRSASGGRGWGWIAALGLLLVGLVAAGAVAAAMQVGPFDRGGDGGETPPGLAASVASPTATAASAASGTASPTVTAAPTRMPTSTATAAPTAITAPPSPTVTPPATATSTVTPAPTATTVPPTATTVPPTATATEIPTATATPPPTATLAPTATDVPTVPPTATAVPVELLPTRPLQEDIADSGSGNSGNGNSGNGNSGNGNSNGNSGNGNGNANGNSGRGSTNIARRGGNGNGNNDSGDESAGDTGSGQTVASSGGAAILIAIAPSDWAGAYTNLDTGLYGQDCVALYGQGSGYESATFSFNLDAVPTSNPTLNLSGLDDEYDAGNPFTFLVNGQQLQAQGDAPAFPQWNGQGSPSFAFATIQLPAPAFVAGQNTITIVNQAPNGVAPGNGEYGPYLLLGSGTLEVS